jgi:hypothetical protein
MSNVKSTNENDRCIRQAQILSDLELLKVKLLLKPDLTSYEKRLLTALQAERVGFEMWVDIGNPNKNHRIILQMLLHTLDVCESIDIDYWADWGTLLGVLRHGNVIPWDWDFDLDFRTNDFEKIESIQQNSKHSHPLYGYRWYADPPAPGYVGYEGEGYSIYHLDTEVLGDLVEYRDPIEGEIESELVCKVEPWHYPNVSVSDIYPLKRVHFLGTSITIPHNPDAILSYYQTEKNIVYSRDHWSQYDSVPFLLSHLQNPHLSTHCEVPVQDAQSLSVDAIQGDIYLLTTPTIILSNLNSEWKKNNTLDTIWDLFQVQGLTPFSPPPSLLRHWGLETDTCLFNVTHESVTKPHFIITNQRGERTRVLLGRVEFLCVPPALVPLLSSLPLDAPVDSLLWDLGDSFPLWSQLIGGVVESGNDVYIPPSWAVRYRLVRDRETGICATIVQ